MSDEKEGTAASKTDGILIKDGLKVNNDFDDISGCNLNVENIYTVLLN